MAKVYGILGDIHSNIDALNVVLEDAVSQGVTDWICTGDVVGYNACPSECVKIVRDELKAPVVCGNHDYYVAGGIWDDPTRPLNVAVFTAPTLAAFDFAA